jgi:uncharacterized membrane protein YphA (DoxX/SURF4 family)
MKNKIGKIILRLGLAIVFLYFSFKQFISPNSWISLLPDFLSNLAYANYIIYLNATFDLLVGLSFLFGLFIKISSILGFLHLILVTFFGLGINSPSGIRDLGLAFASLSLFFLSNKDE